MASVEIPVVDLSAFFHGGDEAARSDAAVQLKTACARLGFVSITGHDVSRRLLDEAFAWSERLFNLPEDEKMKAPHPSGPTPHRGYSHPGQEKVYSKAEMDENAIESAGASLRKVQDFKESYEIGSEQNLAQLNIWLPEECLPGFKNFMVEFYWKLDKTAKTVAKAFAKALHLSDEDEMYFESIHSGHNNQLRLLHYPPVRVEKLKSHVLARMPAHVDWGTFTILFQDDCGGLELEDPNKPGTFLPAIPDPNAMVLNVGDMLMRMSNEEFISATHRVTLPPRTLDEAATLDRFQDGNLPEKTRRRYSIPYFVAPDETAIVECFSSSIKYNRPAKYDSIQYSDYGAWISKYQYAAANNTGKNTVVKPKLADL